MLGRVGNTRVVEAVAAVERSCAAHSGQHQSGHVVHHRVHVNPNNNVINQLIWRRIELILMYLTPTWLHRLTMSLNWCSLPERDWSL